MHGALLEDHIAELVRVDGLSHNMRQHVEELEVLVLDVEITRHRVEVVARATILVRTLKEGRKNNRRNQSELDGRMLTGSAT